MKKRILIIDDDEDVTPVLSLMLDLAGYSVSRISREDGIYYIPAELPDLILLDIAVAGGYGRNIHRFLKSHEQLRPIPVILISAVHNIEQIAKDIGADDYITKPFSVNPCLDKIAEFARA